MKIIDILTDIRPEFDFTQSNDFIGDGMLDSFDLITLVASLEKEYHISIKGIDIIPEKFSSLKTIANLLKDYGVQNEV